ncbi:MAG: hypothetical protein JXM70_24495 [Pirellulales bacterium]|nr:hypothetical protein [Pirellulales bacterium]
MPIIEPPGQSQQLSQGDILSDVNLFVTKHGWESNGGEYKKYSSEFCLVLSRPCVLEHKPTVVAAKIAKFPDIVPKDANSFKKIKDLLEFMRDGGESPDIFYLGQLPGREGRFCARFDAIFTLQVPSEPDQWSQFLEKRIGSLNSDFVRDLHIRLFTAFARLGFQDVCWLSDQDLAWLVKTAEADILKAKAELASAKAEQEKLSSAGKQSQQGSIETLEAKVLSLTNSVQPYLDERSRRESGSAP